MQSSSPKGTFIESRKEHLEAVSRHVWQKVGRMPWPVSTTLTSRWSFEDSMKTPTRPPSGRELDCIRKQIPDHLLQPVGVAADCLRAGSDIECETHVLGCRQGRMSSSAACATAARSTGCRANRMAPPEDSRRIQEIVDHVRER